MQELIDAFTVERIGKAGTKFDIHKAQWFNQQYLRARSNDDLVAYLMSSLTLEGITCDHEKALKIVGVMKERVVFPQDFWGQGRFFFYAPTSFDESVVSKKWNEDAVKVLANYREAVLTLDAPDANTFKTTLERVTQELGIGTGKILQALRLSITGLGGGPDLMVIMEVIGKEEVATRIAYAIEHLKLKVA